MLAGTRPPAAAAADPGAAAGRGRSPGLLLLLLVAGRLLLWLRSLNVRHADLVAHKGAGIRGGLRLREGGGQEVVRVQGVSPAWLVGGLGLGAPDVGDVQRKVWAVGDGGVHHAGLCVRVEVGALGQGGLRELALGEGAVLHGRAAQVIGCSAGGGGRGGGRGRGGEGMFW